MDRLREPSTWAGFGLILSQGGKALFPEWGFVFDALATLAGGYAVYQRERAVR